MLSSELKKLVIAPARNMILIWSAIMAATLIYVVVVWFLFRGTKSAVDAASDSQLLMVGIGIAGLLSAIASVVLEKIFLSENKIMKQLDQKPDAATALRSQTLGSEVASGEKSALFERLSGTEQRLVGLLPLYQTAMIVIWAMRESIAIWGVVLAILLERFLVVVPFAAVALVLVAIKPPRPAAFLEANRNSAQNFG
jgi:hypothetical protein